MGGYLSIWSHRERNQVPKRVSAMPFPDTLGDDSTDSTTCFSHLKPSSTESSWYDPCSDERSLPQKWFHTTTYSSNSEGEHSQRRCRLKHVRSKQPNWDAEEVAKDLMSSSHPEDHKGSSRCSLISWNIFNNNKINTEGVCIFKISTFHYPSRKHTTQ